MPSNADREVNYHIKAPGADQAKQELNALRDAMEKFGYSAEDANKKTTQSGEQAAEATEKVKQKTSALGPVLGNAANQLKTFVAGWVGLQGVQKILDAIIRRMENMVRLMREFYRDSLSMQEVGQQLEFQTGTTGRQKFWAQQALDMQRAGGIRDIGTAGQMMIAGDIAFGSQGGIQNPDTMNLLKSISPFVGAAGLTGEETAKLFEFAQTAGVPATEAGWQQYLAMLQQGFTASKATSFGAFMTGLQKGGTPYMASGGSFAEAVSLFSGARSVTANEALAGTLLEQVTRLSGGAYEKPRQAMEAALGVNWAELSTDQRAQALLMYTQQLPDSQRSQFLAEAGFAPELINQLSRMVSPAGLETIAATRQKVTGATTADLQAMTGAYLQSDIARQRQTEAEIDASRLKQGPAFAAWSRRMQTAQQTYEDRFLNKDDDPFLREAVEPSVIAMRQIQEELDALIESGTLNDEGLQKARDLQDLINRHLPHMQHFGNQFLYPKARAERTVYEAEEGLQQVKDGTTTVINYNNNTIIQERPPQADVRSEGR